VAPDKAHKVLDGFCPEPHPDEQIALNANGFMLFLRVADIGWLEADGDCVVLHVGKKRHRLRGTLAAVAAKLPAGRFLRISPSVLVNKREMQEVLPLFRGTLLRNGARPTFRSAF
jgi:two-component system, LytTR family, response regulator